jgi:UTP--glucose-1-phosphate uridylyltransferase
MKQPTKAIICAAGLGTRFLPQTKAMPKEMLPIIDKPVIQLIVEQAVASGVTDIIIVTGISKRAIEDHFDRSSELEYELRESGKNDKADEIKAIAEMANFTYVRQKGTPKGSARPVLNSRHLINDDEPFFVFFADDFFRSSTPWPSQLKDAYNKTGKSVISLIEVDKKDADKYGMADIGEKLTDRIFKLNGLVERPGKENTPSSFASVGSYLLTPDIWQYLEQEKILPNGEIGVITSINDLARDDMVYGCFIDGVWHDTGDKLKYIEAIIDTVLENPEYSDSIRAYLAERLKR